MHNYRSDYSILQAIRVTKTKLLTGEIRNINKEKINVTSEYAIIQTVHGLVNAVPGDWLVITDYKDYVVVPDKLFKHLYRKF